MKKLEELKKEFQNTCQRSEQLRKRYQQLEEEFLLKAADITLKQRKIMEKLDEINNELLELKERKC